MSGSSSEFLNEFHWLMDVLHNIDVGLVVLDLDFKVKLWNGFMQNHSALNSADVLEESIFKIFPELPESWFQRKLQSVKVLQNSAFTTWEERPYLFRFKNYRPVTGSAEFMYQNCTILPLSNARGEVAHICLIIYDVTEVAVNRLQLQAANAKLHEISRTDGLTGLLNRKTWEHSLIHEFRRYRRRPERQWSLIMFDIDHFKQVNDNYGHPAGDAVIRKTAEVLMESIREVDLAGRYGGEEFGIVLLDTDAKGAQVVAERIRKSVEATTVHYDQHAINFTVSLGIAQLNPHVNTPTQWIEYADKALYTAKESGRNNSQIYL